MNMRTKFILTGLTLFVFCNFITPAHAETGTWTNTVPNGYWHSSGNWLNGNIPNGADATADFSTLDLLSNNTVRLNMPGTLSAVIFGDTDTNSAASWTLNNNGASTNVLTLTGSPASITVNPLGVGATATISTELAGSSGMTKDGAGTLVLTGQNSYDGETVIDAGKICLNKYDLYQDVAAYYQFNDSENLGADSSGNNNTLITASGSPAYSEDGKYGGALYLDGASTLNTGGSFPAGVPSGGSPFTVSAWIKPTTQCAVQRGGWVGWGNPADNEANNFRLLDANANAVWIYWWNSDIGGWLPSGSRFDDGAYHSVVVTWDGTTEIIYLDGIESNRRNTAPPNVAAANFIVGKTIADSNFIGWVDDLLIASRAFSPAEVDDLLSERTPVLPTKSAVTIAENASLDLNGVNQPVGSLSGFGTVTNSSATPVTLTLGYGNFGDVFHGAIMAGSDFTLEKVGSGQQTLCGTNIDVENVVIKDGTLKLSQLPPDAVAYYQFNNPSILGQDSSGYGNTLDESAGESAPQYSPDGKFGGAVYFDGAGSLDSASGQFPTGVPTGNAPYTVSAYIKASPSSNEDGGWIGYGWTDISQCNNFRMIHSNYNEVWNYWWGNDFGATMPTGNFTDGWHSVVGTWDGTTEKLYIDGVVRNQRTPSPPNIQPVLFVVGKTLVNEYLTGWVDDLLIADRAYDASEITTLLAEDYNYSVLPPNVSMQISSGAILDLNGISQSISSLSDGAISGGIVTNSNAYPPVTLTVNNNTDCEFGGTIADGGVTGAVSLLKSGEGILTLSGTNSFSGATVISGGTLQLSANGVLPAATEVELSGGTLKLNGYTNTVNMLTVSSNSVIALNSGEGLLNFSGDSSALTWSGDLTLTGTLGKEGPTCIRFYPDGLTREQLHSISINGNPVTLDENLYLIQQNAGMVILIK